MTSESLEQFKQQMIADYNERVENHIIERQNADFIIGLLEKAESRDEAVNIAELGLTLKRTGFHFDKRLDKIQTGQTIRYLKKNEDLSFSDGSDKPHHKLIIGDNYAALQNLLITHKGRVDVIYIDPPYGKDDMGQYADTNYDNAITRDNLLSQLYPRLVLARELLSDEGVIFCSIDDKNQAYVKCLFDEVFGEANFIATVIWERAYAPINLKKHFSASHDYVLVFAKNKAMAVCNGIPRSDEADSRYSNPDNDPRGVWQSDNLSVGPAVQENIYPITTPSGRVVEPPAGRSWSLSEKAFSERLKDNRIWFGPDGDNVPRMKRFLSELRKPGITPMTIWKYDEVGHSQDATKYLASIFDGEKRFDYPKPVKLIARCVSLYSKPDSIVLDFYAGSGTTGEALLSVNKRDGGTRKFILVTSDEDGIARDVTAERLKRVMTGNTYGGTNDFAWLEKNEPYGGSLDVYEIEEVNNFEQAPDKNPFDVIDEKAYGQDFGEDVQAKIEWVCENFDHAQKYIEGDV